MQYEPLRVIRPRQFNSGTAQTPGSRRLAAVHAGAGIDSPMWGSAPSPLNLQLARQSTITANKTRSPTYSVAPPMFAGASGENSVRSCMRAISSMFLHGFRTRRSILRASCPSNGSSSAALLNLSFGICPIPSGIKSLSLQTIPMPPKKNGEYIVFIERTLNFAR